MNVEDSYEGAIRRLQRLSQAGFDLGPPASLDSKSEEPEEEEAALQTRLRELELATLACDDNERLERELTGAREQIHSLQRVVATLQEALASPQQPFGQPDVDSAPGLTGSKRGPVFYATVGALVAGCASAALFTLRPWERSQGASALAAMAAAPVAAPAAVVAPPPKVEPTPVVPTAVPTPVVATPSVKPAAPTPPGPVVTKPVVTKPPVAAPAPSPRERGHSASAKRHHSHHSETKHHSKSAQVASKPESTRTSDPLGGLNL